MRDFEHLPGTDAELLPNTLHEAQAEIVRLRHHLQLALRQWRMYADTERQFDEDWLEGADDEEARLYNAALQVAHQREEER